MSFRRMRGVLGCGLGLVVFVVSSFARAQATAPARLEVTAADADEESDEQVRDLMRAGVAEYRKKNLEGARQAFTRAWERARRPEIAAALADVEMKLGRYRDAAEHWDRYLQSNPTDKAEASERFNECRAHVAEVLVELTPAGAALDVDGARMLLGSRGLIWLEPGPHRLAARFEGRTSPEETVDLVAGQQSGVSLTVPPSSPVTVAKPAPVAPVAPNAVNALPVTRDNAPSQSATYGSNIEARTVVLVGGVVLTAAGAGLGVWSLVRSNAADDDRKQLLRELRDENPAGPENSVCAPSNGVDPPPKCADVSAKVRDIDHARNWALGSFIGAGAFGVATVATYLLWPSPKAGTANSWSVTPLAGRGRHGLSLATTF